MKKIINNIQKTFTRLVITALLVIPITGCELTYGLLVASSCNNRPNIKIFPEKLPEAKIDTPYMVQFSASQNRTPINGYNLSDGQLPIGINLVGKKSPTGDNVAFLEGTPTKRGDFPITIEVSSYGTMCVGQRGSREYILTVNAT